MGKLRCDICGGQIEMQPDKRGVCLNCGTSYSLDTMREMFTGVKVSVTGSNENVEQWRQLLDKYYSSGDFTEAERTVKKILEAIPNDAQASEKYEQLQVLKYMEIKNGILTSYSGAAKVLVVPEIVKDIAPGVFKENQYLEEAVLPNGLKTIKEDMFCKCSRLKKVYIPPTVTAIENAAFYSCTSLTEIDIPASVKSIGCNVGQFDSGVFEKCASLTKITLHLGLKRLEPNTFSKTALEDVTLPEGLEVIGGAAFYSCTSLTEIDIPASVKIIEYDAFRSCKSLKKVGLSSGLKEIGFYAFSETALEEVILPEGLEVIKSGAFRDCISLRRLVVPDSVIDLYENKKNTSYFSQPWRGCSNLESIEYPKRFDPTAFQDTAYYDKLIEERRKFGLCLHCGGEIGLFSGRCKKCGAK